jgi:hypothetical protein
MYNIDIWLEIVGTIWNSAASSNFSCAQVNIFMRSVYTKPNLHVFVREKSRFGSAVTRGLWSQRNEHLGWNEIDSWPRCIAQRHLSPDLLTIDKWLVLMRF